MNPNPEHQLAEVLRQTRMLLALPGNDFGWSHWNSMEEALCEFDALVDPINKGDAPPLSELGRLFVPTGSIQEVSINSGWGEEFLALAQRFDTLIKKM